MTKTEIFEFLNNKNNWTKNLADKDLWSYLDMPGLFKIGKQKYDWAIFKRDKNIGFYFAESYKEIPMDLINDLYDMLIESENNHDIGNKK